MHSVKQDEPQRTVSGADPLSLCAIHDPHDFDRLGDEWDALVHRMSQPSPYLLHGYLLASWRHYVGTGAGAILCARREGALVAALPILIQREGVPRVARLMCGRYAGADLALAGGECVNTGVQLLSCARELPIDLLQVIGVEPGAGIDAALEAYGDPLKEEATGAPTVTIEHSWEQTYERNTTSKTRNLHRKRWRQLAAIGKLDVELARSRDELERALDEALRLHRLRWQKRLDDVSDMMTARGAQFQHDVVRGLERTDAARIVLLRLDGRAIAFHYYFVLAGTMFVHRLAFDPEFEKYSPGLLATLRAIELAAAEGVTRVDFGRGSERYKLQLADGVLPLRWGHCLRDGWRGRYGATSLELRHSLRTQLKRSSIVSSAYLTAKSLRRQADD